MAFQVYAYKDEYEGKTIKEGAFALICDGHGHILLGQRGYLTPEGKPVSYAGHFNLIGGGVDPGETSLQAVIREVMEETGVDITEDGVTITPVNFPLYVYVSRTDTVDIAHSFLVEIPHPIEPKKSNETLDFHWADGQNIAADGRLTVCGRSDDSPGRTPAMIAFGVSLQGPVMEEHPEEGDDEWIKVESNTISRKVGGCVKTYRLLLPKIVDGKLIAIE
jgi:8-oxo-dGTP pyrophosphatase MutT (NUDIX family)